MTERLIAHLFGYLVIYVTGANRVKFLRSCTNQGIPLWSVRTRAGTLILCTSVTGFKAMRRPARQHRCEVRVYKRLGIPFFLQRIRRRFTFSLGATLFIVILWLLSSFVWFIEIEGSEKLSESDLSHYLREHGLHVGAWCNSIGHESLAAEILRDYPELAWAGISIEGSRVHVKLVDKAIVSPQPKNPGDVVAAKSGILLKIIATSGQAAAKPGQTVTMGQVLIRGEVIVEEEVALQVMAEGIAEARVWYEAIGYSQVSRAVEYPTGASAVAELISIGGREVQVSGVKSLPYVRFEKEVAKRILLPGVEHITITYRELAIENEIVTGEQAVAEAKAYAEEIMRELLPSDTSVVNEKYSEEWSENESSVTVRYLVETHEDIGKFVPYNYGSSPQ